MPIVPSSGTRQVRYSLRSLAYVAYPTGSYNVDPNYPISRMADLQHYRRSTRLTADSGLFAIDFGADVDVAAFSLELANVGLLYIEGATSAQPTTWQSIGPIVTDSRDPEDGRRKGLLIPVPVAAGGLVPFHHRYARCTPSSLDPGETVVKIGTLGAWPTFPSLGNNPATPYVKEYEDTLDGSTTPTRIVLSFPVVVEHGDLAAFEEWLAIVRLPRERVMLWYENQGDATKWYHLRRTGVARSARDGWWDFSGIEMKQVVSRDLDR